MGFLRWLLNWLFSGPKDSRKQWHPDLNPIDIEQISRELGLKDKARHLGAGGVPLETDTKLSGPEAAVVFKIEEARGNFIAWGSRRLTADNEELSRNDITKMINHAAKADEEFERLAASKLTAVEPSLRELGGRASRLQQELDKFRHENRLDRMLMAPGGAKVFFLCSLLLLMILIESAANAHFFSQGLETGMFGGMRQAAVAAAINVLIAAAGGFLLVRLKNHVSVMYKMLGWTSLASLIALACIISFAIAHYRDALVSQLPQPGRHVLDTLIPDFFRLHDIYSWMLVLVSLAFSLLAILEGYKLADPYPGYAAKWHAADEAIADYNDEIHTLHGDLDKLRNEMLSLVASTAAKAEASVAAFEMVIDSKKRASHNLSVALEGAESALHALLQEFRGENCLARGDKPPPAYFQTWPQLKQLPMPDFNTTGDEENLANQRKMVAQYLADLEDIRARIQSAYNNRFSGLQPLHTHFAQLTQLSQPSDLRSGASVKPDSIIDPS